MYSTLVERISQQLLSEDIEGGLLSLPESLMSLRRLCHDPKTDVYDVELAVAKEPAFAAYILKLANSALYGAGKIPCQNLISVIRRLGINNVSQYALTFALKKCHDHENVPENIALLLRNNWQLAWNVAQEATQFYSHHRLIGNKAAKRIDLSDILMLGVLLHTGRLAILTDFCLQEQGESFYEAQFICDAADKNNMKLLPILFNHWGLPASYAQHFSNVAEANQPLHAVDYLFAVALLKAYPKKAEDKSSQYNFLSSTCTVAETIKLAERFCALGILSEDDFNLTLGRPNGAMIRNNTDVSGTGGDAGGIHSTSNSKVTFSAEL